MTPLSHVDAQGRAQMVNVAAKAPTSRQALAEGSLILSAEAFEAMQQQTLKKGDPFTVAKLAGIGAAKRTDELVPLCHSLPLEHIEIVFESDPGTCTIHVLCEAATTAKTGIEMEAMMAVSVALLALYDMVKAVDPAATITAIQLLRKTGGKTGFSRFKEAS